MVFNRLSTIFQLYRGGQLFLLDETGENYRLYRILLYRVYLAMNGVRTHNLQF
jgi:hypothetical protein